MAERENYWNWISVKDKLPELETEVLVWNEDTAQPDIATLFDDGYWFTRETAIFSQCPKIEWWMPLPAKPKIKSN